MASTKDEIKAANERNQFLEFARCLVLNVNTESVQSRPKPEPDILFTDQEQTVAFELVEICNETIAHHIGAFIADQIVSGPSVLTSDPTPVIVRRKLKKTYKTEFPVELLCYWDGRANSSDAQVLHAIKNELEGAPAHPYRKIWYFGERSISSLDPRGNFISNAQFDMREPLFVTNLDA